MISIQGNSITNKLVIENIENLLICSLACNITDFAELNNWVIRSAMDVTLKVAKNELSNERNNLKALIIYLFFLHSYPADFCRWIESQKPKRNYLNLQKKQNPYY